MKAPVTILVLSLLHAATATEFHVAPSGSDSNPGTKEKPFATLGRAAAALAARTTAQRAGAVDVVLHAGTYQLQDSINLGTAQSGTEAAPVTWRAAGDGPVCVSGAINIPGSAIQEVTDPVTLGRLPERSRKDLRLFEIPLSRLGLDTFPPLNPRGFGRSPTPVWPELFQHGVPLPLSAWPNGTGYENGFHPVKVIDAKTGNAISARDAKEKMAFDFVFDNQRIARWKRAMERFHADPFFGGHWYWDWADDFIPAGSIDANGHVHMAQKHVYGAGRYINLHIYNLVEEMDQPGEYTLDRAGKRILVLLETGRTSGLSLSWLGSPFFVLEKAAHLRFDGIQFDGCRFEALRLDRCADVQFNHCRFTRIGGTAVHAQGVRITVRDSAFSCLGAGGVSLAGGDRATLTHADNVVEHCLFENFGRLRRTYAPGVSLAGVGNRVANCLFRNAPHSAILFGGNEHAIRDNEISSVLTETGDCGAIYGGRDWTAHGTVISGNWIHDLGGHAGRWACGIYLDDQLSGITVTNNWVDHVELGMLVGGGRYDRIQGNIISHAQHGISADARGLGWGKTRLFPILVKRLGEVPLDKEPWKSRYPMLLHILEEEPGKPIGTRITGNAMVDCKATWLQTGAKNGAVLTPNFTGLPTANLVVDGRHVSVRNTPLRFEKPDVGPRGLPGPSKLAAPRLDKVQHQTSSNGK